MKLRHLTISTLALILMTACSDATGLESDNIAGTWTATSIIFTQTAAPNAIVDVVAVDGAAVILVLDADETYTFTFTSPLEPPENEAGAYTVTGYQLESLPNGHGQPRDVYNLQGRRHHDANGFRHVRV